MTEITIAEHEDQPTVVLRGQVPMTELTSFFDRAFHETMAAIQGEGKQPAGPPFGRYHGLPAETVDVEAGFPVAEPIGSPDAEAAGEATRVTNGVLPGGRVAEALHVGPYDTLAQTYGEVMRWIGDQGLRPASDTMWESYLSDPRTEPDPATWRTLVSVPVA